MVLHAIHGKSVKITAAASLYEMLFTGNLIVVLYNRLVSLHD